MTSLVLRYKGLADRQSQAVESLRRQYPSIELTPKTSNLFEAQVADWLVPRLQEQLSDWDVSLPTYAEIKKPAFDFSRIRDKLGG